MIETLSAPGTTQRAGDISMYEKVGERLGNKKCLRRKSELRGAHSMQNTSQDPALVPCNYMINMLLR